MRTVEIGDSVMFVDIGRIAHEAIVTQVWPDSVIDLKYIDENTVEQASTAVHNKDERVADCMFWY